MYFRFGFCIIRLYSVLNLVNLLGSQYTDNTLFTHNLGKKVEDSLRRECIGEWNQNQTTMLGPQITTRRNVLGKSILLFSSLSLLLFKEKDPNLFVSSQPLLSVLLVVVFFWSKKINKTDKWHLYWYDNNKTEQWNKTHNNIRNHSWGKTRSGRHENREKKEG